MEKLIVKVSHLATTYSTSGLLGVGITLAVSIGFFFRAKR